MDGDIQSMAKKYYWLKLKENFFTAKEIKKLRHIAGGDTYTVIYLKMMLLSLQDEGKLYFDGIEDSFSDELALELDEDPDNVKVTLMYLQKLGLLVETNETEAFLTQVPESIGKETDKAELMRKLRASRAIGNNVTELLPDCYTDIDINKEKKIDIDNNAGIRMEIIDYLNTKTGKHFNAKAASNAKLIDARLKEGRTVDDFKRVIDNKVSDWKDTEQDQYLRPETLFNASHFESYLNQRTVKPKQKGNTLSDDMSHDYDMERLRKAAKE